MKAATAALCGAGWKHERRITGLSRSCHGDVTRLCQPAYVIRSGIPIREVAAQLAALGLPARVPHIASRVSLRVRKDSP